jgi:threonine/homoserine/homoserine lactone efflux protein
MTSAEQFRASVDRATCEVSVAGVPWPAYKLYAVAVGVLVLVAGLATVSTATAVLSAAGAATIVWLAFSAYCSSRR